MNRRSPEKAATLAGIGLVAGLVGAGVMLLGQRAEMALTKRSPSSTPAEAVDALTGMAVADGPHEAALSTAAHFAFGTGLGLGFVAIERVPEPARLLLFFGGAWGAGTAIITGLGVADPPTEWPRDRLAIDLGHHAVYAVTVAATFFGLRRLARL